MEISPISPAVVFKRKSSNWYLPIGLAGVVDDQYEAALFCQLGYAPAYIVDGAESKVRYPADDCGGDRLLLVIPRGRCVVYGAGRTFGIDAVVVRIVAVYKLDE